MEKILTIFERDWDGNRGVIDKYIPVLADFPAELNRGQATEKFDGTNVRITVRNNLLVRLEKRRNPSKVQKHQGIKDPWYIDADEYNRQDKYLFEATQNTDLSDVPDGEWPAEAIGPKIQGNPLQIEKHTLVIFSMESRLKSITFNDAPIDFIGLKEWLPKQRSHLNPEMPIEGIVWHLMIEMYKIKIKDFK